MIAASMTSWLGTVAIVDRQTAEEVLYGMAGPLALACGTWLLVDRTYKRSPESLTPLMVAAFFGKMVFFAAYIAVMLRLLQLRFVPFAVSFTAYFIALFIIEALYLRRLFSGRSQ